MCQLNDVVYLLLQLLFCWCVVASVKYIRCQMRCKFFFSSIFCIIPRSHFAVAYMSVVFFIIIVCDGFFILLLSGILTEFTNTTSFPGCFLSICLNSLFPFLSWQSTFALHRHIRTIFFLSFIDRFLNGISHEILWDFKFDTN